MAQPGNKAADEDVLNSGDELERCHNRTDANMMRTQRDWSRII